MKITMLGTGNALVTECYNTCFAIEDNGKYFLVDGGGGNGILSQLKKASIDLNNIRDIFVTHKHVDHVMGIIWIVRLICQGMAENTYEGEANIYTFAELAELIKDFASQVLTKKQAAFIDDRLHFVIIDNGESRNIINHEVIFFDIMSTKAKQFGFTMNLETIQGEGSNTGKLTCCGDEPYNEACEKYAIGSKWLMHEAFCLYNEADVFHQYEKHHSTVKDASELAEKLSVENLILYHTEDKNIAIRKEKYTAEGKEYFSGNIFVPDDLEVITIV